MSAAIGPSAVSGDAASWPSRAALDAEIARYQKELSDCVNCPSSKTPQGKAHVQAISNQISADRQRIQQIDAAETTGGTAPGGTAGGYTDTGRPASTQGSDTGRVISVFA